LCTFISQDDTVQNDHLSIPTTVKRPLITHRLTSISF